MGSLERRLDALEERHAPLSESEARQREHWFAYQAICRRESLSDPDADHARGLINLYRTQGILSGMDTEELVERILAWRPVPECGRSRVTVEREVALAIYRKREGTEHMECEPDWQEAFVAGDELLRRYEEAPDGDLAEVFAGMMRCEEEGDEEGVERWTRKLWEDVVGSVELLEEAIGPDAGEISEEERTRRLEEALADALFGEKHYRVGWLIRAMRGEG